MKVHRMYCAFLFLTGCLLRSQAVSTLNQDYFKILFELHSEEVPVCLPEE